MFIQPPCTRCLLPFLFALFIVHLSLSSPFSSISPVLFLPTYLSTVCPSSLPSPIRPSIASFHPSVHYSSVHPPSTHPATDGALPWDVGSGLETPGSTCRALHVWASRPASELMPRAPSTVRVTGCGCSSVLDAGHSLVQRGLTEACSRRWALHPTHPFCRSSWPDRSCDSTMKRTRTVLCGPELILAP